MTTTNCDSQDLHYLEWVQKYFDIADVVFLGKVVHTDVPYRLVPPISPASPAPTTPKQTDSAASMKELLEMIEAGQAINSPSPTTPFQTATFELVRLWKGPAGTLISGESLITSQENSVPFQVGETFLVFGFKNEGDGNYLIPTGCAFTLPGQDTPSRIRVLNALTKKPVAN